MSNAGDPFQSQRKAAEQKQAKDAAAQQVTAQQGRITAAKAKREAPKFGKPYPWPKPFWA